jgi:hypothetical protein
MPRKDIFVSQTEVFYQAFFTVMGDEAYIHMRSSGHLKEWVKQNETNVCIFDFIILKSTQKINAELIKIGNNTQKVYFSYMDKDISDLVILSRMSL